MHVFKKALLLLLLATASLPAQAGTKWVTPDFAIFTSSLRPATSQFRANGQDCRVAIASAVCLVDPPEGDDFGKERPCQEGSATYAKYFEELYDLFPAHLQKMFCHLPKIFIEKEFIGSAYGGLLTEDGKQDGRILGGILGIRRSLLDNPYSLDEWASWKEQIHFGTDAKRVNSVPGLPLVQTDLPPAHWSMLYFLVAHEFGHIFDFTNKLNEGGSWQALSWKSAEVPLDQFEFSLRKDLCFYFCEGKFISAARQDELYLSLGKTNFISAYATRYSAEDFADTLGFYSLMTEKNAAYRISTASGLVYEPIERLRADPLLASKRLYLEKFLSSVFKYPGE
ncbi:MAG: hypothetical protein ACXWQO_09495 [Bdellovibrionota bacterium]